MLNGLIPDPRPSKAHPEHRAQRKAIERENPHFDTKEFGLKAGILVLLAGIACYPWAKKYAEHENADGSKSEARQRKEDKEARGSEGDRRRDRRSGDKRRR